MKTLYLVTGAAGYLGGEVCRQLVARGLQGRALVLPGDKTAQYAAKVVIENFLPGFSANEQAKAAYGMTFAQIGPMLGLPDSALQGLLAALDNL